MRLPSASLRRVLAAAFMLLALPAAATDVDGPDCVHDLLDYGDAPEEVLAYPGVVGHFPSCNFGSGPGDQQVACAPLSSPPGITGFVAHVNFAGSGYWLGCASDGAAPMGIDSEADAKLNDTGAAAGTCSPAIDCVEAAFGMSFGQDECLASSDAGVAALPDFVACAAASVTFRTTNCAPTREAFLNILVDWNEDGDWNDNFQCGGAACAHEWAVKNVLVVVPNGCDTHVSPLFQVGPRPGRGWMRITLSDAPVGEDFPWNGSAGVEGGRLRGGESEDYPVVIGVPEPPCDIGYVDFGDAPEDLAAYPFGGPGAFPTCIAPTVPGGQQLACVPPPSVPPGPTGYVKHVSTPNDPYHFWFGCAPVGVGGVDGEFDGKVNAAGAGQPSTCNQAVLADCSEFPFGLPVGQDECLGDGVDAGWVSGDDFPSCGMARVDFRATLCEAVPQDAYLNVLVDWNHDGDWNDVADCPSLLLCAPEWAVKNQIVLLQPGCQVYMSPDFQVGARPGPSWMRITLSPSPAPDDFPWNGTVSLGDAFRAGETEDYVAMVYQSPIGVPGGEVPDELWLGAPAPNPGRDEATLVRFGLPREAAVALSVFDVAGREVVELLRGTMPAGVHAVPWAFRDARGRTVPAGLYLVALEAEGTTLRRRVLRVP